MTDQDPTEYRVLLVDNDPAVWEWTSNAITGASLGNDVVLHVAADEVAALAIIEEHYIDLVLLDIFLKEGSNDPSGYEFLQALEDIGSSCQVIIITTSSRPPDSYRLIQATTRLSGPRVVNYLWKGEADAQDMLEDLLRTAVEAFKGGVRVEGLAFAAELLRKRADRYPSKKHCIRRNGNEIEVEIERVCRSLFGEIEGHHRSTDVLVSLAGLARRGLSAAVLLRAGARLSIRDVPSQADSFECVMKLGPVEDMREEAARYREFVRYGVRLEQRVELYGSAYADAIGGLIYSFAGGLYGHRLTTLDELLRSDKELALRVIENLFETVNWYAVPAKPRSIKSYIDAIYRGGMRKGLNRNLQSLQNVSRAVPGVSVHVSSPDDDISIEMSKTPRLKLPGERIFGAGAALMAHPQCLVHGDMHGGNIMAELSENKESSNSTTDLARVCLIDFRSAGPGPRCIDAAALEASIRIADADDISFEVGSCEGKDLTGQNLEAALRVAISRNEAEKQLYDHAWGVRRTAPSSGWARLSLAVMRGVMSSFPKDPITFEEYAHTGILYALRQFGYQLDPVVRMRLAAWLSVLYGRR